MGEIGKEAVTTIKNMTWTVFTYALACGSMVKAILVIFVVDIQPAAAYSVAGIGLRTSLRLRTADGGDNAAGRGDIGHGQSSSKI